MTVSGTSSKRVLVWAGLACAAMTSTLAPGPASAQGRYPDKAIRMLVGFAAGGPTDVIARKLSAVIGPTLGQSVVVENKPGASTTIATTELVKSAPDGHTLYFTGSAALTITPLSIPNLSFDVARDLAPVALVAAEQLAIAVHPSVRARTLKELAALIKANPGKVSFGSSGTGNVGHLTGELFNQQAGASTCSTSPTRARGRRCRTCWPATYRCLPRVWAACMRSTSQASWWCWR